MVKEEFKTKKVIGIWVRTTNHEQQAMSDIQNLWERFMSEQIPTKVPNKINDVVYSIYTEYEGDHTKPYTTVLAFEVSSLEDIPEGMKGLEIGNGNYVKFVAKGDINKGAIGAEWMKIWQSDVDRRYATDFEVYDERSQDPSDVEVDIFVGVN